MAIQISLFTTQEGPWWQERQYDPDERVRDVLPRGEAFRSGNATLLSGGDGRVTGIARGGRRGSASDFRSNVAFDRIEAITPVPFGELQAAVRPRSRGAIEHVFSSGFGLLSEAASSDVRDWFATHDPPASRMLDRILTSEPDWMLQAPDLAAQFRSERDAVNLALEIASLDREHALRGISPPASAGHFAFTQDVSVMEDTIVVDDLDLFPGWDRVAALRPSGRVFEDVASSRCLTVLLANKNPIERTTGADLVYFIHDYRSFVLVQYKRVRREGNQVLLRLDYQLDEELERMRTLESAVRDPSTHPASLHDQRLSDGFCFLKLCQTEQPSEVYDLSRGKYLSLETWDLMLAAGLMKGPKDGRRLLVEDATRYHSNTGFAELVSEGWVGSRTTQFETLVDLIFELYEAGRAVVLGSLELGSSLRRLPSDARTLRSRPVVV